MRESTIQLELVLFFYLIFFVIACAEQSLLSCLMVFSCIHVEGGKKEKEGRSISGAARLGVFSQMDGHLSITIMMVNAGALELSSGE